ncbi:hypothetical protein [Streptomyces sp. cg36]|uniref:hypothetical protein n=1 Tax=Streptomyces sp. cg36 TaxID=3238798 RepID=UPI0034E1AF04
MTATIEAEKALSALPGREEGDLDVLCRWLPSWAVGHGMRLLENLPQGNAPIWWAPDAMGLEEFCTLAHRLGVCLLYMNAEPFDADTFDVGAGCAELLDAADRKRLALLKTRAAREQGRCQELAVRFMSGGIIHAWTMEALWHDELGTELVELEEKYEDELEAAADPEDPPATPEEVDRIAGLLHALPAFREAARNTERERITLREHPGLRSCRHHGLSRLGYEAVNEAALRVSDAAKVAYADFAARVPELVDEILKAGVLSSAANAPSRKAALRVYLQERSGGYPPTKDFVELIAGEPLLKSAYRKPQLPTAPDLWS